MNATQTSALLTAIPTGVHASPMYLPPYNGMDENALGQHFATRSNAHFFAVPDPDETQRQKIEAILSDRFELNGEAHCFDATVTWMVNPSADVEWHILLHKFYYAVGLGMAYQDTGHSQYLRKWVALVTSWIDTTPPGFIAADVTGRRVQNWIYAHIFFAKAIGSKDYPASLFRRVLDALHVQVEFLREHLTPARNHRTLELYAIFLASIAFPEFSQARLWREFALSELVRNIQTDLLDDGVQCELSTDYHHLVLKNYLCVRRLAKLNAIEVPAVMDQRLIQALEFSLFVHKPDGVVPSLSDGDARSFLPLLREGYELYGREDMLYVATQGREGKAPRRSAYGFPSSGYYIMRSGWGSPQRRYTDEHYLVFDCGPLGAGNHGHLDCLNIEVAAFGRSLVVDPGRYTYSESGETNWRVEFRSTRSHNTVTVDQKNQTRYEPRVIKDASRHRSGSVRHRIVGSAPDAQLRTFFAEYGFGLLHGVARSQEYSAVHERQIAYLFQEYWLICDHLRDDVQRQYDCYFHLSETAQNKVEISRRWGTQIVNSPNLVLAHEDRSDIDIEIESGHVSYRYGHKHAAPVIRLRQYAANARFNTVLYPYLDVAPETAIREMPVNNVNAMPHVNACALNIQTRSAAHSTNDFVLLADSAFGVWRFGRFLFSGRHLAIRQDASGEIVAIHADRGALLEIDGVRVDWRGAAA